VEFDPHGKGSTWDPEAVLVPGSSREVVRYGSEEMKTQYKTIDEYIKSFPPDIQQILERMRQTIRRAAPDATEAISYRMPAFKEKGILAWFAAFRDHVSFFPTASGVEAFENELKPYITGKGTVQFPLDKPIPFDLVEKVVRFRVEANLRKKGAG
jgi:uncharacterized protein YdhG (YjbR/CyaY superfamily)